LSVNSKKNLGKNNKINKKLFIEKKIKNLSYGNIIEV